VCTEGGGQQEVDVHFSTVTLNVTPPQAEQVLMAQKMGSLTAVLRNPDDKALLAKTVLDESMFTNIAARPAAGSRNGRFIEMIVGGTGTPGGSRVRTEESAGNPLAALLRSAVNQPVAPVASERPTASAGDVRSRLGINSAVVKAANSLPSTKQ
jgi:pilus assembly protein CpaB